MREFVLVVDDDPLIAKLVAKHLTLEVKSLHSGRRLETWESNTAPQAILLDVVFQNEEKEGIDYIPIIRRKWPYTALIVITGSPYPEIIANAFAAGADDFIKKPVRKNELLSRLQARILYKKREAEKDVLHFEDFQINRSGRFIERNSNRQYLSAIEIDVLSIFAQAGGTVITRDVLRGHCWAGVKVSDNAIDRRLHSIRRALKNLSSQVGIQSIYGHGFVMRLR